MGDRPIDRVRSAWPVAALVGIACAATWLGTRGDLVLDRVALTATINLIVVVGLYSFVGTSGVFSFGHMAFMAIGAYVAALLSMPPATKEFLLPAAPGWLRSIQVDAVPATLCGAIAAALFAILVAPPVIRLSGIAAGLAMFALLNIVFVVLSNLDEITNGSQGLSGVPVTTTQTSALLWALAVIVVVYAFQCSRFGLRLRGSREDEVAARACAVRVGRERALAFVLSAFVIGLGGGLMANFLGSFTPQAFYLDITFLTIMMLVLGGKNSLTGAVIGVLVVSVLSEFLRQVEQGWDFGLVTVPARPGLQDLVLATIVIVMLALRPSGIMGGRELDELTQHIRAKRGRRERRAPPDGTDPPAIDRPSAAVPYPDG